MSKSFAAASFDLRNSASQFISTAGDANNSCSTLRQADGTGFAKPLRGTGDHSDLTAEIGR
jgi:hypothetical protein